MSSYIKSLRDQDGYISLRDKHYEDINAFPALGDNMNDIIQDPDTADDEDQAGNHEDDEMTNSETSVNLTPIFAKETTAYDMVERDDGDTPPTKKDDHERGSTSDNLSTETPQTPTELGNLGNPTEKVGHLDKTSNNYGENKGEKEVKQADEPNEQVKKDSSKVSPKETEGRVRNSSVSLLRLLSKLSAAPPSPNQTPASSSTSRSVSPAPGQSLGLLERPLVKHIRDLIQ